MEIVEVDKIITEINEELYEFFVDTDNVDIEDQIYITLETNGYSGIILMFLGTCIWFSEEDEREYINENTPEEDYEPLKPFLIKKINEMCKLVGTVELKGEIND